MQRLPIHNASPLPDDEESQAMKMCCPSSGTTVHNGHTIVSMALLTSSTSTDKLLIKPTISNGQKQLVECSTKVLFFVSLASLIVMLCLTIISTSSSSTTPSSVNVAHHGEFITVDESFGAKARVFPVTYLDVDFSNTENLHLNRVRGICKIYLSTYFMFNYNERSPSTYNPPTVIGADGIVETPYTHWKKIERTLQFLDGEESNYIDEHDIILFSDSTDVFFINNVDLVRDVFENYYMKQLSNIDLVTDAEKDWPLVFIAEKNKWPPNDYIKSMFEKTPEELEMVQKHYYNKDGYHVNENCDRKTQRIYLNSGLYVGRKRDVRKALTIGINLRRAEPKERLGDQAVYQYIYTTKKYPILMDCESKMFFSPFSVCQTVTSDPTSKWFCKISEDNKPTPETVVALHSNGGFCPSLCNCFSSMKEKGTIKRMVSLYKNMSFKSYDINTKQVKDVLMDYACGKFIDESFPIKSCNVQPGK